MKSLPSVLAIISMFFFFTCFQSVISEEPNSDLMRLVNNRKLFSAWDFENAIKALKDSTKNGFTAKDIDTALIALDSNTRNVRDLHQVPEAKLSPKLLKDAANSARSKKFYKDQNRAKGKSKYAASILSLAPDGYMMSKDAAKALYERNNIGHNTKAVAEAVGIGSLGAASGALFGSFGGPVGSAVGAVLLGSTGAALHISDKWVGKKDHKAIKDLIRKHKGEIPAKQQHSTYQKVKSYFFKRPGSRVTAAKISK